MRRFAILSAVLSLLAAPSPTAAVSAFDVFLGVDRAGKISLYFVDARTGLSVVVAAPGTRHTLLATGVIYQEDETGVIRLAHPAGRSDPYPLFQLAGPDTAVDWVVSANRLHLAYALSRREGTTVFSDLHIANADGSERKLALHTSSTQGLGALPLALSNDGATLFYTRRSDIFEPRAALPPVEQVLRLDIATGETTPLPNGTGCPCVVGFSPDGTKFGRLEPAGGNQGGGFALRLWDLKLSLETRIETPRSNFTQAGNLVFSEDGLLAAYTVSRNVTASRSEHALMWVDLRQRQQRPLSLAGEANISANVRLIAGAFSRDNTLLILGSTRPGTYKYSPANRALAQVSAFTFLGHIPPG